MIDVAGVVAGRVHLVLLMLSIIYEGDDLTCCFSRALFTDDYAPSTSFKSKNDVEPRTTWDERRGCWGCCRTGFALLTQRSHMVTPGSHQQLPPRSAFDK
jgi:hypothetical protein